MTLFTRKMQCETAVREEKHKYNNKVSKESSHKYTNIKHLGSSYRLPHATEWRSGVHPALIPRLLVQAPTDERLWPHPMSGTRTPAIDQQPHPM